jgi:ABC-2 type transport system permease protein
MNAILALVRKDLLLYINDRRALMLHLLIPIVVAAFFGSLFGGSGKSQSGKIDIALVQQDRSPVGERIAAGLKADPNLRVEALTLIEARAKVTAGKVSVAVVIPEGFGAAAGNAFFGAGTKPELPVLYDPSQSTVLAMVKGLLTQQVMQHVSAEMFSGKGGQELTERTIADIENAASADPDRVALRDMLRSVRAYQVRQDQQVVKTPAAAAPEGGLKMPFETRDEAVSAGPVYNVYAHSFAGMGVQFILFMGVDLGIAMLTARRTGIWNRLLAAPITQGQVLLSRMVSGTLIAAALLVVMFVVAVLVFGVTIHSVAGFVLIALSFAAMTATFGLLIAAFGKTPEAARGIATLATLLIVMLGGAWVPSFIFPEWLQTVSKAVPARWAIDGLDAVTWRGLGLEAAAQSSLALAGFALVFGLLAVWQFRSREQ